MKKGIIKKIICGLAICSTGVAALGLINCSVLDQDLVGNKKYQTQVMQELDADMQIMQDYSYLNGLDASKLVKLRPNDSKKMYINIDESIQGRERENIKSSINDFNAVFKNINDSYNFVICENKDESIGNTAINFKYTTLPESVYGLTETAVNKLNYFNFNTPKENCYIIGATIFLDYNIFPQLADVTQLQILKHEILHTLGFADLYTGYDDETSLMNVGIMGVSTKFSPNDLKMLYVAYGNKHINSDGSFNQEKMNEVKAKIDAYEQNYYKYLIDIVKDNTKYSFEDLNNEDLNDLSFTKNEANITIKNGEYEYTFNGTTKKGKLVIGEDYAIIPDIKRANRYNKGSLYNDFLIIAKRKGKITCFDIDIYHSLTGEQIDQASLGIDILMN